MTTDSRQTDEFAAHLDDILPPGRAAIRAPTGDEPAIRAAVRIAHDPRPALLPETRNRMESQVLARADRVFVRRRFMRVARWAAAACLMVALLAAILVVTSSGSPSDRAAQLADQGAFSAPGPLAPSSHDTCVYIPLDVMSPPVALTELGGGSSSIFVLPVTP